MADDASYNTFLSKANQDPNQSSKPTDASAPSDHKPPTSQSTSTQSTSQARSKFDPSTQPNDSLPASIKKVANNSSYSYTSDTDSPFEPVFFSYSGSGSPSAEDFKKCLEHDEHKGGEVEELSIGDFDPRGQYQAITDAVTGAGTGGRGEVRVFRVEVSRTRVEYYVVTVAEDGRKLIGVVAKAVES